jgi:chromosome segregation ATPase
MMKPKVQLSVADSAARHLSTLATPEEKVGWLLAELASTDEKRAKLQLYTEEQAKTMSRLEATLKEKQEEIGGLQYNLERLKRRLQVLQDECQGKVAAIHQSGGMLGELKSSFSFFKSSKPPTETPDSSKELKDKLAELLAENGSLEGLTRALHLRNSRIKKSFG